MANFKSYFDELEKNKEPTLNKLIPSIAVIKETLNTFQKNQTENIDEEAINLLVSNLLISIDSKVASSGHVAEFRRILAEK